MFAIWNISEFPKVKNLRLGKSKFLRFANGTNYQIQIKGLGPPFQPPKFFFKKNLNHIYLNRETIIKKKLKKKRTEK